MHMIMLCFLCAVVYQYLPLLEVLRLPQATLDAAIAQEEATEACHAEL